MSWGVGDDEWLAEPPVVLGAGPIDPLDARVTQALSANSPPAMAMAPEHVAESSSEGLPPPPYSPAFDMNGDTSSYESGSFVADSFPADEPELDFHIPVLTLGVAAESSPADEHQAAGWISSDLQDEVQGESSAFVIPVLSASPATTATDEAFEEVGAEELEDVVDAPVRTGDTVIVRAPATEPPIADSNYDDDDAALVVPELVERIDSAELLLEPEREDVEREPDHASATASSSDGFVIPTLARADTSEDEAPVEEPDDQPVLGITPKELLLPLLASGIASELVLSESPGPRLPSDETTVEHAGQDSEDADAESIESLDTADLEEVEQPVAVALAIESSEPKPPAPPEAKPQTKRRKAWYDDVFGEHFLFLYPLSWEETCQRDAQFIFSQLGAREQLSVLDVGCGEGSHAVELAKIGARVTGIDNSLALLLAAAQTKENAALEEGRVEFIHGDMRRLPRDREFDAVICVGTTLGYFEEEQNWLCLQEMHDRLLPGGRLLIHVFNRDFVAPHLPSRSWWQGKRCMVIDEAEMNFFANRLRVHRTIIFDDGRQYEHHMFMRAYTVQDLGKAISQLGMRVLEVSGSRDTPGRFYGSASPDIWIVAEKK